MALLGSNHTRNFFSQKPIPRISHCAVPSSLSSKFVPAQIISPTSLKTHEMLHWQPGSLPLAAQPARLRVHTFLARSDQVSLAFVKKCHFLHKHRNVHVSAPQNNKTIWKRTEYKRVVVLKGKGLALSVVIHQGASLFWCSWGTLQSVVKSFYQLHFNLVHIWEALWSSILEYYIQYRPGGQAAKRFGRLGLAIPDEWKLRSPTSAGETN